MASQKLTPPKMQYNPLWLPSYFAEVNEFIVATKRSNLPYDGGLALETRAHIIHPQGVELVNFYSKHYKSYIYTLKTPDTYWDLKDRLDDEKVAWLETNLQTIEQLQTYDWWVESIKKPFDLTENYKLSVTPRELQIATLPNTNAEYTVCYVSINRKIQEEVYNKQPVKYHKIHPRSATIYIE